MVIEPFGDSETETIYSGWRSRKLPRDIQIRARRKLRMIIQSITEPREFTGSSCKPVGTIERKLERILEYSNQSAIAHHLQVEGRAR